MKPNAHFTLPVMKPNSHLALPVMKPNSHLAPPVMKPNSHLTLPFMKPNSHLTLPVMRPNSHLALPVSSHAARYEILKPSRLMHVPRSSMEPGEVARVSINQAKTRRRFANSSDLADALVVTESKINDLFFRMVWWGRSTNSTRSSRFLWTGTGRDPAAQFEKSALLKTGQTRKYCGDIFGHHVKKNACLGNRKLHGLTSANVIIYLISISYFSVFVF